MIEQQAPERIRVVVRAGKKDWVGIAYSPDAGDPSTIHEYVRPDLAPVAQPPEQVQQAAAAIKQLYWDKDIDEANYQVEAVLSKYFPSASVQPPSPQSEANTAWQIVQEWCATIENGVLQPPGRLTELAKRIASALTSAQPE